MIDDGARGLLLFRKDGLIDKAKPNNRSASESLRTDPALVQIGIAEQVLQDLTFELPAIGDGVSHVFETGIVPKDREGAHAPPDRKHPRRHQNGTA